MPDSTPFSKILAERTRAAHSDSEGASFMSDLMRGRGSLADYAALSAQHWYVYEAIETAADALREDPVAAPFLDVALTRLPRIEDDLSHLYGEGWRTALAPVPATRQYADRVREVSGWAGGVVAHHYTRYLGDLSGGQYIARVMRRHYGLDREGLSFYDFSALGDLDAFKDAYRRSLDEAPWDAEERERVLDEVLLAYRFNSDVFRDLDAAKATAA